MPSSEPCILSHPSTGDTGVDVSPHLQLKAMYWLRGGYHQIRANPFTTIGALQALRWSCEQLSMFLVASKKIGILSKRTVKGH